MENLFTAANDAAKKIREEKQAKQVDNLLDLLNDKVLVELLEVEAGGKGADLTALVYLYAKVSFGAKGLQAGLYWGQRLDDWLYNVNSRLGALGKAEYMRVKLDRRAKESVAVSVNAISDAILRKELELAFGLDCSDIEKTVLAEAYDCLKHGEFTSAVKAVYELPNPNGNNGHYTRLFRQLLEAVLRNGGAEDLFYMFAKMVDTAKPFGLTDNLHLALATLKKKNFEACVLFHSLLESEASKAKQYGILQSCIALDKLSLKKSTFNARMKQYKGNLKRYAPLFEKVLSDMKASKLTLENCFVWAFGHLQGDEQGKAIWLHIKEVAKGLQGSNLTTKISKYRKAAPTMEYWISGSAAYLNASNFNLAKTMLAAKRKDSQAEVKAAVSQVKPESNGLFGEMLSEDEQNKALLEVWTSKGQMQQTKEVLDMERKAEAKALAKLLSKLNASLESWSNSANLLSTGKRGILESYFEMSSRAGLEACRAFEMDKEVACWFFVQGKLKELQELKSFHKSWGLIEGDIDILVEDQMDSYNGRKNLFKVRPYRFTVVRRTDNASPAKLVDKTIFVGNMEQAVLALAQDVVNVFYNNKG